MKTQQVTRVLEGSTPLAKDSNISTLKWKLNGNQGTLAKQSGLAVVAKAV